MPVERILPITLREPTVTSKHAKSKVIESGFFEPERFIPVNGTEIARTDIGILYKIGEYDNGEFYYVKSLVNNQRNIIFYDQFFQRQRFDRSHQRIKKRTINKIKRSQNHVANPDAIDPLHKESQDVVKNTWPLLEYIFEDGIIGNLTPMHFLEVDLGNDNMGNSFGEIDGLGISSLGNFWVFEHALQLYAGGLSKYRQVENIADKFEKRFHIKEPSGRVCLITSELNSNCLFIKIGYANLPVKS